MKERLWTLPLKLPTEFVVHKLFTVVEIYFDVGDRVVEGGADKCDGNKMTSNYYIRPWARSLLLYNWSTEADRVLRL